jgi:hypothetical protein
MRSGTGTLGEAAGKRSATTRATWRLSNGVERGAVSADHGHADAIAAPLEQAIRVRLRAPPNATP